MLIIRRSKLYNTASGIITSVGGRPVHTCAEEYNKLIIKQEFVHKVGQLLRLRIVNSPQEFEGCCLQLRKLDTLLVRLRFESSAQI